MRGEVILVGCRAGLLTTAEARAALAGCVARARHRREWFEDGVEETHTTALPLDAATVECPTRVWARDVALTLRGHGSSQ